MRRLRAVLATVLIVGAVGLVAGAGTFAAFSATSVNAGNTFAAGTVALSDNDAGSSMYGVANRVPGDSVTTCIRVTYTGSLAADVKLYSLSAVDTVDQYLDLTVQKGSMPSGTEKARSSAKAISWNVFLRSGEPLTRYSAPSISISSKDASSICAA